MSIFRSIIVLALLISPLAGCSEAPTSKTDSSPKQTQQNPGTESRRKAVAGVGKKGKKLEKHNGPLATPVKALFRTRQKLIFMKVDQALRLYQAEFGFFPKSQDVFMEKIIRANNIELPELPTDQRYEYDPETHELMVVTPASPQQ